ncbi:Adenylate cyclase [Phytophthora ramorum]|uniref:Adenylate cyclase n=1 Tax=Phytophthora ramorum TaxID=164328 RepID=UPI003098D6E7|nr:Adenylate cyclase [Phytophthora ramorum]
MEVEQEVCATAAAAEGSVASEADQKPAERLREAAAERLRWISKRQERLERMEKLLKLLELQGASNSNDEPIEAQAANSEAEKNPTDDQKSRNKAAAVLSRKKELKELQARAETAKEKQQQAATVLIRNLRQLTAVRHAAQLTTTQWSPASKRKREEGDAEEQPSKKTDFGSDGAREDSVPSPEMHSFSATLELDVGTAELSRAACFRIATRYFLTTGTRIPGNVLEQAFKTYTGKALDEVVSASSLDRALVCFNTLGTKHTIYHSSSEIRSKRVWWQPGRQFLRSPTFIASDAEQIQKLIDVEKQIVMDVCESLRMSGNQHSKSTVLNTMRRQKLFLASLLNDGNAAASSLTLSNILAACIGVGSSKSTTNLAKRIHYRSHGQMAGVFANMESWLREQAETIEPQNSISSRLAGVSSGPRKDECFFTTRYTKPFCVENDSIVNQLRGVGTLYTSTTQKIDPLKVFCQYELNGICNDKNCSNYHQKDYEPVVTNIDNPSGGAGGDTRVLYSKETTDQLLLLFADFRGRMTTKWPVIITTESPSALAGNCTKTAPHADSGLPVVQDMQRIAEASNEDGDDFIRLDIPEELSEIGDSRYFDDVESRKGYGDSLQAKVERDPNDADAWLLLAIYHLELDVGLSDEAANLSDNARLQHQLIYLCKKLSVSQSSSTFRDLNIEEANLTRCLHTLSRALEVEANAYCEALWLLYLHLCGEAANKQMEIDMVEHAVQFLPSSHALWLRYISTYDFDSVSMAEGVFWRLMEHLARVNSTEDGEDAAQVTPSKDLSILLTAMCFHLCIKLWRAGATSRVLKLLSAFLKLGDTPSEFDWCGMVDLLQQNDSDSLLWKENQATLIQLFRKYMGEMSVKSEMLRQVSKRIERDLDRNALEDAVLAGPEKATFYSSFTDALALASEFSLAFSDTAVHEWELLAARASLRKCLGGAKTQHSQVLQALVAVELRLRNMKSVSSLLQKEMQADPLLLETWRLVVGLEILFGGELAERSEKIAVEMEKRQLVFVCNTFGDDKAIDGVTSSLVKDSASATSLTLRGLGLECVPNSVLLKNELISLDLTGNELTELPIDLNRLKSLQKLDVSENALVDFPECLNNMPNLRELHLAHNNLSVVSMRQLPNLSTMDLRWNTVEHLAVSDLAALKSIKMLRTEGNRIPVEEQSKMLDLLSSRKKINACDARLLTGCQSLREVAGEKNEEQSTHALLPVSPSPEGVEDSATASTEAGKPMGAEISSAIAAEGTTNSMSKTDDGDQVMNAEEVNINIPVTQDDDGDQIMDVEEVDPSSVMIKHNEGEMVDDHAINSTLAAKEHVIIAAAEEVDTISVSKVDSRDRIAEKEGDVDIDAAATVFMTVNDTVHQPKEVIDVSSSESLEEAERDAEEQAQAASNNTEMSANVGNVWMPLANDEPCTETITEAEDFAQAHSNVITEAAERQRVGPGAACAALNKLTAYMEQNQIDSRAEVRRRNPALWQEFVAANLHGTTGVPRCRLCFAPGGQRFNSTILCLDCLEQALQVLKKRIDDFEQ